MTLELESVETGILDAAVLLLCVSLLLRLSAVERVVRPHPPVRDDVLTRVTCHLTFTGFRKSTRKRHYSSSPCVSTTTYLRLRHDYLNVFSTASRADLLMDLRGVVFRRFPRAR